MLLPLVETFTLLAPPVGRVTAGTEMLPAPLLSVSPRDEPDKENAPSVTSPAKKNQAAQTISERNECKVCIHSTRGVGEFLRQSCLIVGIVIIHSSCLKILWQF